MVGTDENCLIGNPLAISFKQLNELCCSCVKNDYYSETARKLFLKKLVPLSNLRLWIYWISSSKFNEKFSCLSDFILLKKGNEMKGYKYYKKVTLTSIFIIRDERK